MSQLELLNACTYMYFNLDRKLFQSTEFKDEIKELFEKHWFFEKINQLTVKKEQDIFLLNSIILYIKNHNKNLFSRLFHYPLKRTGNAEVMLFLLLKNSFLSNSGTAGNDIIINDGLKSISGKHSSLNWNETSNQWSLSDEGSTNGTFV